MRVPTGFAVEVRARAAASGSTVAALLASFVAAPAPIQPPQRGALTGAAPQPMQPTVCLLDHRHTPDCPRVVDQTPRRVGRCSCKSPSLSTLVSNLCTNCGQLR